jgi:hypothetical protein
MHLVLFLPLFALTMSSLRAKLGKFERVAQVRGFSPPQGEDAPHKTQRIGGRQPCSDLQVRSLRVLVRQGPRAGAAQRQTKHGCKRAVCASPSHRALRAICRQTAALQSLNGCSSRGAGRVAWTVDGCGQSRVAVAKSRLSIHSVSLRGILQSLRICALHFCHWPSALHCCSPNLLCADLRRGCRWGGARVTCCCRHLAGAVAVAARGTGHCAVTFVASPARCGPHCFWTCRVSCDDGIPSRSACTGNELWALCRLVVF